MLRRPLFRLIALLVALIGSLSAPAQALAHGMAHEHLAHEHEASPSESRNEHHDEASRHHRVVATSSDTPTDATLLEPLEGGGHRHGHPTLDAIAGTRDLIRVPVAPAVPAVVPPTISVHLTRWQLRAPARSDRVLLARPDPERGPPPALRAPPTI